MKPMRVAPLFALVLLASVPALAVQPDEIMSDPAMEHRAREISKELRCLVCQNQSIDDSNAPLARDLRVLVRERLTAGDSDDQVLSFVTDRYGDFVLLKPPFKATTWLLWLAPAAFLGVGGFATWRFLRGRAKGVADNAEDGGTGFEAPLDEEENRRLAALLDEDRGRA